MMVHEWMNVTAISLNYNAWLKILYTLFLFLNTHFLDQNWRVEEEEKAEKYTSIF